MNIPLTRHILSITIVFIFSAYLATGQPGTRRYEKEWKKADELVEKGLPMSALTEVKKIYALAKAEKQEPQIIKALVYMANLQTQNRENNRDSTIVEIEQELRTAREPAASILRSILATSYLNYYQRIRWQLYSRTATTNFKKDDIATWGFEDFHSKIGELFLQSIAQVKLLQQTKLDPWSAIIIKGNVRHLRPTLYDLLAHRALDYFRNDDRDIKKPAYAFQIDQPSAFSPASEFARTRFVTRDSLSLQHKALLVYQDLISFHLADAKPDALIDVDLARLEYVKNKSVHPGKDALYLEALNDITRRYGIIPPATEAWFRIANFYHEKGETYKPYGDSTHRFDLLKAKEICEKVLAQKDSSEGKIHCYNLLKDITQQTLQFNVEKVNLPGIPFRVRVQYKNFNRLFLRIVKADEKIKKDLENVYDEKYWPTLISATALKTWEQALPVTNDMQDHGVEIKADALPVGEYLLIASTSKDFGAKTTVLGARLFYVSGISFVNDHHDYFVLDRDNGQPLSKAAVQVWISNYDYRTSKYTRVKGKLYTTDANGYFRMDKNKPGDYNTSYFLEITHGKDRLFLNEQLERYYPYEDRVQVAPVQDEKEIDRNTYTYFFTDRSIYRPGQTLFFKGIAIVTNKEKKASVRDNFNTRVYLFNANHQKIDSLSLQTNEYGSFSGKFQLPQSGLNGQFSLQMPSQNTGIHFFRVEEYKRPKFAVEYEKVKGTYKLDDKIKITGLAKAYAGNNIDGATVSYRVVRQPRFLYPWLYSRSWLPSSSPMEIAHGVTTTDKDGKFSVEFTAIPDLKVDKKYDPVFDYTIYADVTDINGETRSGQKMISVGYKALKLVVMIPASLPADSLNAMFVRTENMNGEFEPADVRVTISKLKDEKRLIRTRFWERPDQFIMTKQEYITLFPHDEYDNETDKETWEKGERVYEKTDSARMNGNWAIAGGKYLPGYYKVEFVTRDKHGGEVKDVKYIELYDESANQLTSVRYIWTKTPQPIEPGQKTSIEIGTSTDNVFLIQQVDKNRGPGAGEAQPLTYTFTRLNNEKKSFEFSATEADRGGYGVSYLFVKHNRFYQSVQSIIVPWTNKNLDIEYATYRDKTLPGSEEKWKIRLTGYKKEQVAAELLAGMYDASLDQFAPHVWHTPSVWPYYYRATSWMSSLNFAMIQSQQKEVGWAERNYKYVIKGYDRLALNMYELRFQHDMNPDVRYKFNQEEESMAETRSVRNFLSVSKEGAPTAQQSRAGWMDDGKLADSISTSEPEDLPANQNVPDVVNVRRNFNETAFFFPDLRTDSTGAIEFSFTMPEALTKWKFQAMSHTKELAFGYSSKEIVTQKQLMVQPNMPRFLREGDKMEFVTKVVNLSEKEITGQVEFQLFDATTNQPVDGRFKNTIPNQFFTISPGQSEAVKFPVEIPFQFNTALTWKVVAKSPGISDGEENTLPVLTNRMLVTETLPVNMRGEGTKTFKFDKLLNSGNSETLQHHAVTVEYTSNPVWYAVQALPYLMEFPYECAEQSWNRYYANSLATMVANSSPRIRQIFEQWKTADTAALLSNLQKNEELKSVLLEETPWVLQAKSEAEQKRNIALLFDMVRMGRELSSSFEKFKQMQSPNGGFVWFKGGPDDRYITQYIITGIGHLKKLKAITDGQDAKLKEILATALPYLDQKIKEDYAELIKNKADLKKFTPYSTIIQYFYMRSFFPEYKIAAASQTAYNYFRGRAQQTWTQQSKYMQGMLVLALGRTGDATTPVSILKSLKETSINNEELGMYWKDAYRGWWWYEAPIERQALLIEAFQEIGKDTKTVNDLRTWLLKNKQTNRWESTKATAEACYALMIQGSGTAQIAALTNEPVVSIQLGNTRVNSQDNKQEAGTGYFKTNIDGQRVNPQMGNITVTVSNSPGSEQSGSASWGGVYWQYFEDLDKITTASTPLKLAKKLFVETNTDRGPVLKPVNNGEVLKIGDKIKVRIELKVDRDMEYVHMKDMRASAMEPVNVLSGYRWQGGLGYYETTKDASTNFFFNHLRKGTYVFEYALFVTNSGNFSNGVTTIQCMYAPEFTSHSEGVRVNVE